MPPATPANKGLRADFHMHTWFSKDCVTPPEALVRRAIKVGLTCIAVTDHDTVKGGLAVQKLAPPELKVIVAEEVKTPYGEITGFFLTETIPAGLEPLEVCKRIKGQGGLVSIPHPFDRVRHYEMTPQLFNSIEAYVDIVEVFNARTIFSSDAKRGLKFAQEHHVLQGAGSDAHCTWELGHVAIEMPEFEGVEGFKSSLALATIHRRSSTPLIHAVSKTNKWRKKYLPFTWKKPA